MSGSQAELETSTIILQLAYKGLRQIGRSFFYLDTTGAVSFHDNSMASGEIYFRRATSIATESPDSNWQVVAQAGLALADYYIYNANPNRAHNAYAETWDLLSQSEERLTVRREQLEQVIPLKQTCILLANPLYSEKVPKPALGAAQISSSEPGDVAVAL